MGRDFINFVRTLPVEHQELIFRDLFSPRKIPPIHTLPQHKRPKLESFLENFHGSNSAIEELLNRLDLRSNKKYLLVYDLDGTVMQAFPNDLIFDIDRAGKSPKAVVQTLSEMNTKYSSKLKSVGLTARNLEDFKESESFNTIPIYGAFGYALRQGEFSYEPHADRNLIMPELMQHIVLVKDLVGRLKEFDIFHLFDLVFDPNAFCLKLRSHNIHIKEPLKTDLLKYLEIYTKQKWTCTESADGTCLILNNTAIPFDKANGINYVLKNEKIDDDTTVVIFGDSGTDLKAMQEAKRVLGKDRVINVAVGPQIAQEEDVDIVFRDHIDTRRFVGRLAKKLAT